LPVDVDREPVAVVGFVEEEEDDDDVDVDVEPEPVVVVGFVDVDVVVVGVVVVDVELVPEAVEPLPGVTASSNGSSWPMSA